jgi:hypothetical protein
VKEEDKDDPVDGHHQGRPMKYDKYKLGEKDLKGDNHRREHQETPSGLEEDQGGEQSSDIKVRRLDTTDHDRKRSPNTGDLSNGQRSSTCEMRNEQGSNTDKSDGVYLGSIGGLEMSCNSHQLHRGEDRDPGEDEHLPQTIDSDTDHGVGQDLGIEGRGGEPHLMKHDQNTCTNTDDSRDIIERGEEKCSRTSGGLISVEEEKRILGRLNMETSVMDTETNNTNTPKDDELNLQLGLVEDEGVPERELVNMESEMTRRNGEEDETILPGHLDELGGERCFQTGVDPTQGEENLGRPDTETSDMDPKTDNTQILEDPDQLRHGAGINEYPDRVVLYSEDDTTMVDHLQEEPMGR